MSEETGAIPDKKQLKAQFKVLIKEMVPNKIPKSEKTQKQYEVLCSIADIRRGKVLSEVYEGSKIKIKIECKEGHIWDVLPGSIKQGTWCPRCAKHGRPKKIKQVIREEEKTPESLESPLEINEQSIPLNIDNIFTDGVNTVVIATTRFGDGAPNIIRSKFDGNI